MLKAETTTARAPRGTKPVSQAFFTALDAIPEHSRAAVAKAAQAAIRDELKARKEKLKAAATKEKARKASAVAEPPAKPAGRGRAAKPAKVAAAPNGALAPVKRRGRKPASENPPD